MPADADTTFTGNGDHLFAELRRLDLLLRRAVLVARAARAGEDSAEFRGLVVSEENVDRMLESFDFLAEPWKVDGQTQSQLDAADHAIEKKRAEINIRLQNAKQQGKRLALPRLAALCGLSAAEVDLLLVALAPELDPRYETLYSYLQNDVTRKRPSADLALNLVCRSKEEKLRARALLSPGAPLLHFGIIELVEEAYDRQATQLRQFPSSIPGLSCTCLISRRLPCPGRRSVPSRLTYKIWPLPRNRVFSWRAWQHRSSAAALNTRSFI